ncbi:MAG: efflux RND transporter periplasmic adaptor subunit [Alphaproteobacteria bacterium]|nr:efflux RND transporter periplasmic adaptor subunit [Alphaproteobacteria bacterium]
MKNLGFCLFLVVLAGCQPEQKTYNGYVEGEYVYIAPTTPGVLDVLSVARGQSVVKGDKLFALDLTNLNASLASNLNEVAQTKAALAAARDEFRRAKTLVDPGGMSKADLEAKKASFESDEAAVHMAEQKVIQMKKQIQEAEPLAPAAGRIEDTYYRSGEYVKEGDPIVSLLPPENVKIRFFVPQAELSRFPLGQVIAVHCDGCAPSIKAKISYIASQSEYSPPVIYSVESRDKLVFMLEAKPEVFDPALRPGLPVDITLTQP